MRDIHELRQRHAKGGNLEFLYFCGHTPPADGSVDQSCLSQWFPAAFTIDGVSYPTAEHWMMASKARLFGDQTTLSAILATPDPEEAKSLGRQVQGFDEAVWAKNRMPLVIKGNWSKFIQHDELRPFLLSSGEKVLVEASPHDAIWGIGLSAADAEKSTPDQWPGQNLLGFALMDVREQIQELTF